MKANDRRKEILSIAIITLVAVIASSNGFHFKDLFFPADVLSDFAPWHDLNRGSAGPKNSLLADPVFTFEPWEELIRRAFSEHRWPLWNPYSFMGSPLLGNGQISAFTVFSLPQHFLSAVPNHFGEVFLKLWLAGVGMFFLARTLGLGMTASLVSGLAFMLSGHMMGWLHLPLSAGLALAPALLLAAEHLLTEPTGLWFVVLTISVAMLATCGQPQTTFCVGLLLIAFSTHRWFDHHRRSPSDTSLRRRAIFLSLGMSLGVGLSAFQSLPFLEYLQRSEAARARDAYNVFYVPLYHLITLVLPDFFGNIVHGNYWGYSNNIGPAMYVGVLSLLLAITAAVLNRRDSVTIFFGSVALIGLLIMTKRFGGDQLMAIPVLRSVTINKFIAPFTVSLAFLAGRGVDLFWFRPRAVINFCVGLWIAGSIAVVATVIYFWRWLASMNLQHYEIARAIPLLLITPLALVGLKLWHLRHNEWTWIPAAMIVITVAVDPLFYWLNFNPSIDKRFFYPTSEGIDRLKKDRETWRLMGVAGALPANTASFYQLQDALGYDAMTYTRYYDFMVMIDPGFKDLVAALEIDKLASKPWNPRTRLFDEWILGLLASKDEGFLPFLRQANYWNSLVRTIHNRRLLDLMNVKYLVSPPGWFPDATLQNLELVYDKEMRIYLNKTVLPRAIAVNRWIVANSDQEAVRLLSDPEFDPARTAVVQNPEPSTKTVEQLASIPMRTDDSAALVTLVSYRSEKIVIQANTANDAVLLLSDTYYPGWRCAIDGENVPIFIADFLFRGIHLPPGNHEIVFSYEPQSFIWGLRISWLAAFGIIASAVAMRKLNSRTNNVPAGTMAHDYKSPTHP